MPYRILVTGSRHYEAMDTVAQALHPWLALARSMDVQLELVHGKCPYGGLDALAGYVWSGWGMPVREMPAKVVGGRILGPERNTEMVALGDYWACLGFPLPGSRGTYDCMRKAAAAGILTMEIK